VCYNQEDVISRALDSVLCQKDWGLFRVVVCDDCSKDRTWEILQKYKSSYPDIVEIHRNDHNLGIYGNVEKSDQYIKTIDYDLMGGLSGDDEYCDGYFEGIQKLIEEQNIDTNEAIGIYSDWMAVYPNGNSSVHHQKLVLSDHKLWSLKIRGLIYGRSMMVSKPVFDSYEPILKGRGLSLTESHYDEQPHLNIRKAYYLPLVTSKYYTGVGVSTRLSLDKSDYLTYQSIERWTYELEYHVHNECDRHYVMYELLKSNYYIKPSVDKFVKMIYHYVKGQLPSCHLSWKSSVKCFLNLAKYGLNYKN